MRLLKPCLDPPAAAPSWRSGPVLARVAPFFVFLALTFCQGQFGPASIYWFYLAKTVVGAWLVWEMYPFVSEMRWALSWEAIAVGIAVFVMWVGIDPLYPQMKPSGSAWNPQGHFGQGSPLALILVVTRLVGVTVVVPPLEEVFYRSFLYRYLVKADFQSVPLNRFAPVPFLATALFFGFEHYQWLAGILCGAAYQWLVWRKNRLGDAMTAHGITNLLLGLWVLWKHAWQFW
ncbi:MAG: CAAX prenyl protease-related protein [Verrucomicrobiota bacterium]